MSLSEVHMCLWVCSDPSKIHSFLWVDSRAKFTQSPRYLCLIKARVCEHLWICLTSGHLGNHRPSLTSTDSNMLQWLRKEVEENHQECRQAPWILALKLPQGNLITCLKLLKPKRPEGLQTHSPGLQQSCQLFHPGWVG